MDIEGCEKLLEQNSNEIAVKRNVWNLFPLDIQLDVFRYLRAYDLHKKAILVSRQWRSAIEKHKGTLPKFRQLTDCRAQNKLVGDNSENLLRGREEVSRRNIEAYEKSLRAYKKRINIYTLLSIASFIAALLAQLGHISVERIVTTLLLLTVTLRMFNAYDELYNRYPFSYSSSEFNPRILGLAIDKGFGNIDSLKHLMPAYLGIRTLVFACIGILRHLITADNIFDTILWSLHFFEGAYILNWSVSVCLFDSLVAYGSSWALGFCFRYERNINWLNPDYPRAFQNIKCLDIDHPTIAEAPDMGVSTQENNFHNVPYIISCISLLLAPE